jgi:1-deoxy-D-xylulose-5-phosphate reductoisomerase
MRQGHLWGAAFNAAKEVALDRFIAGDIGFLDMAILVEKALHDMDRAGLLGTAPRDLPDVLQADQATRERAWTLHV